MGWLQGALLLQRGEGGREEGTHGLLSKADAVVLGLRLGHNHFADSDSDSDSDSLLTTRKRYKITKTLVQITIVSIRIYNCVSKNNFKNLNLKLRVV